MSEARADILVDIPDEDLPKLAKIYEEHKEWAPHAYSTITTGIEWKKSENGKLMTFMSPNNCWKDDGTFFAILKYHSFDIFIFTLDESGKNVYEALMKTKRLETDFKDRPRLFYSVHNKLFPVVERFVKEKKFEMTEIMPCDLYSIPKEEALKFDTECPPDLYIKKLDKTHANLVNENWPHRYNDSQKYVALIAEMNGAYGVFLKSSNELVSWALISLMGQLGLVQTVDGHKRKGYASLITKYVSKELAKKGHNPSGTVLVENIVSQMMFEKVGFRSLGISTYIHF